jgi:hypothetical protein
MPPWVVVGPSSIASTRLPLIASGSGTSSGELARTTTLDGLDAVFIRGIDLINKYEVGAGKICRAGEIIEFVTGTVRIGHRDP